MAVTMMSKNPDWVYIDEDEVFAPSEMIQITPRKQEMKQSWLKSVKKPSDAASQKRRHLDWCEILHLTVIMLLAIITMLLGIIMIILATCGIVYVFLDDMDTYHFIRTLELTILPSFLSVWFLFMLTTELRKKYSNDIKVRKVFNENNNADVYIDEDEVFAPSEMIQITPRKQEMKQSWLNSITIIWYKTTIHALATFPILVICGLVILTRHAILGDMDTYHFNGLLVMMILGSILSVFLLCFLPTELRKMYSNDIKVRKVFNENNADVHIDIDY